MTNNFGVKISAKFEVKKKRRTVLDMAEHCF